MGWDIYGVTHVKNNRYFPHFFEGTNHHLLLEFARGIVPPLPRVRGRVAPNFFASIVS
jgi:hypothetical protein